MNQARITWDGGICIVDGRGYTCTNDGRTVCVPTPGTATTIPTASPTMPVETLFEWGKRNATHRV